VQDANAILFIIDSKGIFRMSEGRALAKIGLRPGQIVGMSALEVYKDNPTVIGALTAALEGRLTRAESIVNGIHFDAIYSPTFDQDGHQDGAIGLAIDISERVRAEEEVRTLNRELDRRVKDRTAQLEAANAELESFSYSVSHDLRAPLRGIDGWAEVFLEECGGSLDDKGRSYLDRIRRETKQMGRLIDDLLRLSRLSCKEIDVQPIDLSAMAERIAASHREREPERDVVWRIRPALTAHGDPALIEVALTNLIGNAWKFSAKTSQASIEIGRDEGSDGAPFFVRDNGAGFDMAYAGKLFGAFQRMHNQTEFPGSGIGLATVKRIIARHGGRIWADAHPGAGATFYFTLEAPPASLQIPTGEYDGRDMTGT
jgi:signal transduction histidine kinase